MSAGKYKDNHRPPILRPQTYRGKTPRHPPLPLQDATKHAAQDPRSPRALPLPARAGAQPSHASRIRDHLRRASRVALLVHGRRIQRITFRQPTPHRERLPSLPPRHSHLPQRRFASRRTPSARIGSHD